MLTWISSLSASSQQQELVRDILILNESKSKIDLYWVHPQMSEAVLMNSNQELPPGAEFPLNSYVGHDFEIREKALEHDGGLIICPHAPDQTCRRSFFTVSENKGQVVHVTPDFQIELLDSKIKAQKQADALVKDCQAAAQAALAQGKEEDALTDLMECVEAGVAQQLERVNEEIAFQASVRTEIAGMLENYTCLDDTLDSTPDVDVTTWQHLDEPPRQVHMKHERAASKIHLIENFIHPDECKAMEEAAATTLHRATVADGKGGSRLSDNRKAMQAGITVPWDKEVDDDPIARLSRRVYDYTNHVLGLDIKEFGQEDLMSIQYFGRGVNDTEPDRYTPHCDGDCTGQPHKVGTRMATLVMYCDVATKGGHTNFRNAGVHIKPAVGSGIFFSYINPETLEMDTGFTEHSGCPVFEGSKKIVTQWVRLGVDDENPWHAFNTLGIKKSEVME